jgi:hypothetical protein
MQHPIGGHHGGGGAGREIAAAGPQTRRSHGAARVQAEARTEIVGFVLTWRRPNIASPGIPLETTLVVAGSVDIGSVPDFLELVDAISIPTQGRAAMPLRDQARRAYDRSHNALHVRSDAALYPCRWAARALVADSVASRLPDSARGRLPSKLGSVRGRPGINPSPRSAKVIGKAPCGTNGCSRRDPAILAQ